MSPVDEKRATLGPPSTSSTSSSRASPPYPTARSTRAASGSHNARSTRQQFSACGACRMRRVRCDLKDLPLPASGLRPSCSNCAERGLKCVDEFAEVKAVKLLRRGRRLQQVEAVYGKAEDEEDGASASPHGNLIPKLQPEFFDSPFFRRLHIQRPIIDATEFSARFLAFSKGDASALSPAGQLIASILVVWGASFGVNEYGVEEEHVFADEPQSPSPETLQRRRDRKDMTNRMLQQILRMIDVHGILRKPSWDGVRALLLTLPLTAEVQPPMERLSMYEATLSQIYTLCSLAPISSVSSGQGDQIDALVRARIFWYAHIHEGVTSGLRGGRVTLTEDDLISFQQTLPDFQSAPLFPDAFGTTPGASRSTLSYSLAARYASLPLRISSACRQIHDVLTGPKARQRRNSLIDEIAMKDAWDALEECWRGLENVKECGTAGVVQEEDIERFIHGWQIFIFECHNIIREGLKQRLMSLAHMQPDSPQSYYLTEGDEQKPVGLRHLRQQQAERLHAVSSAKCHQVVLRVVRIIRHHFASHNGDPPFFAYDASLMRDGCFFAAFLLASDDSGAYAGGEDELTADIEICLRALRAMRWGFSKSEEREGTVRMVWEATRRKRLERASALLQQNAQNPVQHMGSLAPPPPEARGQRPFLTPLALADPAPAGMSVRQSARTDGLSPWSAGPVSAAPLSPVQQTPTSHGGSPSQPTAPAFVRQALPPIATSHLPAHDRSPPSAGPSSHTPATAFNDGLPPIQASSYYYPGQAYGYAAGGEMERAGGPMQGMEPPRQIQLDPAPGHHRHDAPADSSLYPTWSPYSPAYPPDPTVYQPPQEYDDPSLVSLRF
ncbi:hypothetical protein PUNSTDRAFT_126687 [Punctularia strigosozonata HHB-11173 SS5]|uniref:uncharacterized protein n=1 Tax=Punctularia strigosozonata (strain HHB-11173) TaxID=741275 RepID=UPI0004416BBB|nr:uncharacterized protein PUNSTDRAFT_126687 [Punctularia strigosozonata HHB-11173 SS5]EIN07736.1 hypothetical protein PUNSTDRAFT_126687 [Punctularia strigosozonata HHB-11173 SS5]